MLGRVNRHFGKRIRRLQRKLRSGDMAWIGPRAQIHIGSIRKHGGERLPAMLGGNI